MTWRDILAVNCITLAAIAFNHYGQQQGLWMFLLAYGIVIAVGGRR